MKNNILLLVLLLSSINILSCSPAGILASGGATGMVVAEGERSFGTVVDDATIKINIASKFINSDDNLFVDVGTNVLEGRVLLTGLVDNQEIRIDAVRRVWDVEGVNE
ncbi:MAG: BON domain-containing protein, partial [Pelagibacteraceae bacterium]|nr:BON domain-containing protein [Pelagibacteraceae bacterium]